MKNAGKGLMFFLAVFLLVQISTSCAQVEKSADPTAAPTKHKLKARQIKPSVKPLPVKVVEPAAKSEKQTAQEKDKNRVMITVNGETLTAAQIDLLLKHRLGRDEASAVEAWTDIKLKSAEARSRGIDKTEEAKFILSLYTEHYMGRMLDEHLVSQAAEMTDKEAREYYDKHITTYQTPMRVRALHITVKDKELAQKVAKEAQQEGVKFEDLVQKYSEAEDKDKKKGKTPNMIYKMWKDLYGQEVADAVAKAKKGDLLGPVAGANGFEIIKVLSKRELETTPFAEAKDRIIRRIQRKAGEDNRKKVLEDLKANAKIEKTAELIELEKKAEERRMRPGGDPRLGGPPRRRRKAP